MPYPAGEDGFASRPEAGAYAVVYVRPETNGVLYERAIAAGISARGGSVIYAANLSGALFRRDRILRDHYATQLRFAEDPQVELARYPQMQERLEAHFGAPCGELPLVGAFQAAARTGLSEEQLFETFVPREDFLACWGQQFKRIGEAVVVNPSLPAVMRRYVPQANVFVVVIRSADGSPGFFAALNRSLYREVSSRAETPLVDGASLGGVPWAERVRRTYHISRSHLMAMYDMSDFVYLSDSRRLDVTDTPLGRRLLAAGVLTEERLRRLKREPLVRRPDPGGLEYLPLAGEGRDLAWTLELLRLL